MKNLIQEKDVVIKKLTSVIDERLSKKTSKNNKRKKVEFDINSSSYVKNPSESTRLKKKSHQLKNIQKKLLEQRKAFTSYSNDLVLILIHKKKFFHTLEKRKFLFFLLLLTLKVLIFWKHWELGLLRLHLQI